MRLPLQLQKQQIILIIGIGMALIAIFMIKVYLDQQTHIAEARARKQLENIEANQTPVLVARKNIEQGAVITPDMLEAEVLPNQYLESGAVKSLDRISGMITVAPIAKGEQITLGKLVYKQAAGNLASLTPAGKRAITINVDNTASLLGMIKAGDYVDVIALLAIPVQVVEGKPITQVTSIPLFQNVLVLAVGRETGGAGAAQEGRYGRPSSSEGGNPLITLALSPEEANLLSFAEEQGKIRLVLRSPMDAKVEPTQLATWDTLFQYIMPQSPKKAAPEPTGYIEVYHGMQKEKIPVYK